MAVKMNDLVTVVVPNYNNEQYIRKCVESIQEQTYSNLEILIIDDGSTDSSIEIIEEMAESDERILPVFNDKNLGISANRHKGIMLANGTYITTLDADDYLYDSSKIEREHEIMNASAKDSVLAFSNFILVNKTGVPLKQQDDRPVEDGDLFSCILSRTCKTPRDFMFTKDQFTESGGFNMALKMYEDWDLKIRMSSRYRFVYTGIDGIAYRRHQSGLSSVKRHVHYKWLKKIYNANIKLFSERVAPDTKRAFEKFIEDNFDYRHKILSFFVY